MSVRKDLNYCRSYVIKIPNKIKICDLESEERCKECLNMYVLVSHRVELEEDIKVENQKVPKMLVVLRKFSPLS